MTMTVQPTTGELYVVGTDATNEVRFEPNLNGKFLRVNVSRFTAAMRARYHHRPQPAHQLQHTLFATGGSQAFCR